MVEAYLIKYKINSFVLSSGFGPDREYSCPAKAVYVPDEKIFVRKDSNTNLMWGPVNLIYEALIGEGAEKAYNLLLKELREIGCKDPEKIEVTAAFVDWAKAMHQARTPSKDISDLLSTF